MRQQRVLLFCHDAKGLGHLRRISRIAGFLQGDFACLVLTGMPEAFWMVPGHCESVKLPNWDGLSKLRASRAGRAVWLDAPSEEVVRLRSELICAVDQAFCPSAILVDYLPFGLRDELRAMLGRSKALKYLIHRGIADRADKEVLYGQASGDFGSVYDRIVVAADKRIVDVAVEHDYEPIARSKLVYVGYVNPVDSAKRTRLHHVTRQNPPSIVVSSGGGVGGEALFAAGIEAARKLTGYAFHIVLGPYGTLGSSQIESIPQNCEMYQECRDLESLHQSAAVVVTHGGYNSVTEAISGGARILVWHKGKPEEDERMEFERRVSRYYALRAVAPGADLAAEIHFEVEAASSSERQGFELDFAGLTRIRRLLEADLT